MFPHRRVQCRDFDGLPVLAVFSIALGVPGPKGVEEPDGKAGQMAGLTGTVRDKPGHVGRKPGTALGMGQPGKRQQRLQRGVVAGGADGVPATPGDRGSGGRYGPGPAPRQSSPRRPPRALSRPVCSGRPRPIPAFPSRQASKADRPRPAACGIHRSASDTAGTGPCLGQRGFPRRLRIHP